MNSMTDDTAPAQNPGGFTWHGPHGKGAMRGLREIKRNEAEARAAAAGQVETCTSCLSRHAVSRKCAPTFEQRIGRAA